MIQNSNSKSVSSFNNEDRLLALVSPILAPLGYEVIHLEMQTQRQKILRIFIDHLNPTAAGAGITVEDCAKASRALDEPLDKISEFETLFKGTFELEVSSPGINRPLRGIQNFERFTGKEVRISLFRPLSAEELGNNRYFTKNPKQKNFLGILNGVQNGPGEKIRLVIPVSGPISGPIKEEVFIPLPLIAKANLEPNFETLSDVSDERE